MSVLGIGILFYTQAVAQPQRPNKEEVFAKLDASKDGQLDKAEFKAGAEKRKEAFKEKHDSRKAFDQMDTDKNGTIEYEEFDKAGQQRMERRGERLDPDALFEKMDTDSDGFVSLEEFKAHKRPEHRRKN